jgi:pyridoxamine 5'-phosphate oxidase
MLEQEIFERVLALLERGANERRDAFHTAAVCTIGLNNSPEARTAVFRRLLKNPFALCCHVDCRSPKAAEIRANPRVSWLFYHATEKLQIRIRGRGTLHTDDELADAQWRASNLFSRRCYCGVAPTTVVDEPSSGLPEFLRERQPTAEESNALGRANFAVLKTVAEELDVYELNVRGHRRLLFVFGENGETKTRWLTP